MRNALAAFATLALVSGMVVWQEPLRATTARRTAAPSFFRSYHASFQGASVTTTGSGVVSRYDGEAILQTDVTPGSTCVVKAAPVAHFPKLHQEGASLSLFAFHSAGAAPTTPSAVARVTAGGTSAGVLRGFGFKWSMGQLYGFTSDT